MIMEDEEGKATEEESEAAESIERGVIACGTAGTAEIDSRSSRK